MNNYKCIYPEPPKCMYNEGVVCENQSCENCGWHPKVAQARLEKFCIEHGVQLPEPEEY